ncbi:hypothetical protein [Mucilaginibacter aquatilis]|uniref:Uncharacterized protein n=1 Tax=Mucilaginibacter aquatilis TaxID=1517760 RepID=A0A6I4I5I7_9SPHI|nr:hypothetical protein [Mucilaginibacter aquatilis]MVN90380.1 hypothetical protein [Mucilaginibacter aquatilis]
MKFITIILLSVLTFDLKAQKREDVTTIKFDSLSTNLPGVKRWIQLPSTGKWSDDGKVPAFIRWATFQFNNQKYYALIYEEISGYYKYPTIQRDWITVSSVDYAVFTASEYQNLLEKLSKKSGKNILVRTANNGSVAGHLGMKANEMITDELYQSISEVLKQSRMSKTNKVFAINSQVIDGKDIVRFLRPVDGTYTSGLLKNDYYEVSYSDFINTMHMQ